VASQKGPHLAERGLGSTLSAPALAAITRRE